MLADVKIKIEIQYLRDWIEYYNSIIQTLSHIPMNIENNEKSNLKQYNNQAINQRS